MSGSYDNPEFDADFLGPEDEREKKVRARFFDGARKAAGQIPFMEDVVAAYYCAMDPATPTRVRGAILAALAYFVLPLDGIPDMIIGIGFTDDASVLLGVMALVRAHVRDEHLDAAKEALCKGGRSPKG
ncbi:YkvA family protein [Stappia sp.]|uniref:YkvA family protein n=1 Tax=Stappia sp. TaxID=1870903 RepID=UPI003A9A617C